MGEVEGSFQRLAMEGIEAHADVRAYLEAAESLAEVVGASLKELGIHTRTGMEILAIERNERWIYRPRAARSLQANDRLLAIGANIRRRSIASRLRGEARNPDRPPSLSG